MTPSQRKLLEDLYTIHSPSGKEWHMIEFVTQYVATHLPNVLIEMDEMGNLYLTKGNPEGGYPTLVCHMDQVQTERSQDFTVVEENGVLYGWSPSKGEHEGLGADDKNGMWVCLLCLERHERLKVLMTVLEEKGIFGAKAARMDFFNDSLYVLEPDRSGNSDFTISLRDFPCCSTDFITAIYNEKYSYHPVEGKGTDILALLINGLSVSCTNISCGYYNPHKHDEYCIMADLENCLAFIEHIISTLNTPYPFHLETETQRYVRQKGLGVTS